MSTQTLRQCLEKSISPRSAALYKRDLDYFWAWVKVAKKCNKAIYPIPRSWLIKFVLEHLNGLSPDRKAALQKLGKRTKGHPLSIKSLKRQLVALSVEHRIRGTVNPVLDSRFAFVMQRLAHGNPIKVRRPLPITGDVLMRLLNVCGDDLRGQRDKAILMVGFAGGGRRRSELAALQVEHLERVENGYIARIPRHKTVGFTKEPLVFPIFDLAARQLDRWLTMSGIKSGPVFRGIHRGGHMHPKMDGQTVLRMIKRLARKAGLPAASYSAHSLRSGFITHAGQRRVPLKDTMAISGHRSYKVANGYYRGGRIVNNPAAHFSATIPGLAFLNPDGPYPQDH